MAIHGSVVSSLEDPANDHLSEIRILPIRIWNVFANEEKLLTKASFSSRLRGEWREIHGLAEIMTADMSAVIIAAATGVN